MNDAIAREIFRIRRSCEHIISAVDRLQFGNVAHHGQQIRDHVSGIHLSVKLLEEQIKVIEKQ